MTCASTHLIKSYAALGLAHSLTPNDSGGKDITQTTQLAGLGGNTESPSERADDRSTAGKIPRGFGKIVRDESGNVVDVELGDEYDDDNEEERGSREAGLMEEVGQPERTDWLLASERQGHAYSTAVVHALEAAAEGAESAHKRARGASGGEKKYLQKLVDVYGDDCERMARDHKRNPAQHTAGELRRALAKAFPVT